MADTYDKNDGDKAGESKTASKSDWAAIHARFWAKVDKRSPDECWPWQASTTRLGYGSFGFERRKVLLAHRVAYMLCNGEIPKGEGHHGAVVMHACDNRSCCNPAHLRLGTQADNIADMKAKGRRKNKLVGEDVAGAVLTAEDVLKIRTDTRIQSVIAAEYNVVQSTIQKIKSGRTWASV